jgi:alanyl-tRNA synthetase
VSAGVRRIEALTGEAAVRFGRELLDRTGRLAHELGAAPEKLPERVEKLLAEAKALKKENERLAAELARAQLSGGSGPEVREAGGYRYLTAELSGLDVPALRQAADELLAGNKVDLVAVGAAGTLIIKVAKGAGLDAGRVIKELAGRAGGRGGGRGQLAQGGGFDLEKAFAALGEVLGG